MDKKKDMKKRSKTELMLDRRIDSKAKSSASTDLSSTDSVKASDRNAGFIEVRELQDEKIKEILYNKHKVGQK